jgi:hypothetical protein
MRGCGLESSGSGKGPMAGSCEHGDEPSGFIKWREFLELLSNCRHLKKDSVALS